MNNLSQMILTVLFLCYLVSPIVLAVQICMRCFRTANKHPSLTNRPVLAASAVSVIGTTLFLAYVSHLILQIRSSTAALGFLVLPVYGVIGGSIIFALTWAMAELIGCRTLWKKSTETINGWKFCLAALILLSTAGLLLNYVHSEFYVRKAGNRSASAEELKALWSRPGTQRDRFIVAALAKNRACPPDILLAIAKIDTPAFREKHQSFRDLMKNDFYAAHRHVAQNPNTPVEALVLLSRSPSPYVISDVARNVRTPIPTLVATSNHPDFIVPLALAGNRNTPPQVLMDLGKNANQYVRQQVAQNTNTPVGTLVMLSKDPEPFVRRLVARNENTPVEALQRLSRDWSGEVRFYVACNPKTPAEVLHRLKDDNDPRAREYASKRSGVSK